MRSTSFSRLSTALILACVLALPGAAKADGPAFGSGSKDGGGILTSGGKDGGTIVTSGGLRSWTRQLRSLARLALFPWAGV